MYTSRLSGPVCTTSLPAPVQSNGFAAPVASNCIQGQPVASNVIQGQPVVAQKRQYVNSKCLSMKYRFNGDFGIGGRPLVLTVDPIDSERSYLKTGLRVWDGGIVLAKYLERYVPGLLQASRKTQIRGLDLGCGTGVAGISLALMGQQALLSDLGGLQAQATEANIAQNSGHIAAAGGSAAFEILDWEKLPSRERFGFFDVVFGADVIWHETLVGPFLNALAWAASGPGVGDILLSHKVRDEESVRMFEQQAAAAGMNVLRKVPSEEFIGDDGHPDVFVYHLRAR